MIYLVASKNCVCLNNFAKLFCGVKTELKKCENVPYVFLSENCYPIVLNIYEIYAEFVNGNGFLKDCNNKTHPNVCYYDGNIYLFVNFKSICNVAVHSFKLKNKQVQITLSQNVAISIDGECVLEAKNFNLTYSHYEMFNELCLIYFLGERNFVAVIKDFQVFYADYFDLVDLQTSEIYFLTRLNDGLNHGRVCHLTKGEQEKYLVYLDDYELHLKSEFLPHIFLDCLLAGNFKYCNALLHSSLKQAEPNSIANFFCEFDFFYPLDAQTFVLIKKDAVQGIYKFEIETDCITNIVLL